MDGHLSRLQVVAVVNILILISGAHVQEFFSGLYTQESDPGHKVCGWSMLSGNAQLFFRAIPLFTFSLPPHSILLFLDLTDPCSLQP